VNTHSFTYLSIGAGESGKSTLFKQMKIIHHNGYTQEECMGYRDIIRSNILQSMKSLIQATHKLGIPIETPENRQRAAKINDYDQETLLNINKIYTQQLGKDLEELWADKGIQETYMHRNQFQLLDSTEYFFKNIERISHPDYIPDQQDVLRCRVKTTGIVESEFDINGIKFRLFDVGGQRNERKKWIHCFDQVTAVIFVSSLSEYDQKCYEDDQTLRMKESLVLFDEITNSQFFTDIPTILFLNKVDLFREKIKHTDLKVCFEDFPGPSKDYESAANFIKEKFLSLNREEGKDIYTHITCATDTQNIQNVFDNVKDIILKQNLPSVQ
jgi:GTPase SAR1 family protein